MRLHAELLFCFDAAGRMVSTNEEPPMRAPQMYLGRTRGGNVWFLHRGVAAGEARELGALLDREPPLGSDESPPACLGAALEILSASALDNVHRGPAFMFETAPAAAAGTKILASGEPANYHPEIRAMGWTAPPDDSRQPFVVYEADGAIVAICHSSRATPGAVAAGVSTAVTYRERGFGLAVTQSWAAEAMAGRRAAFYSTSWDNLASRSIARRLGLRFIGEDCSIG